MNIEQMNTIVETILGECESIIAETENITEELTLEPVFCDELFEIRCSAEEVQSLIVNIEENEFISNDMLDNLENKSIQLYQNIKYSLEGFETENESSTSPEVLQSFVYMRNSVNEIRTAVEELITKMKI